MLRSCASEGEIKGPGGVFARCVHGAAGSVRVEGAAAPSQRDRPGLLAAGAAALWGERGTAARSGAGPRDGRGAAAQGMLRSQGMLRRPLAGALGSKSLMLSRKRKVLGEWEEVSGMQLGQVHGITGWFGLEGTTKIIDALFVV